MTPEIPPPRDQLADAADPTLAPFAAVTSEQARANHPFPLRGEEDLLVDEGSLDLFLVRGGPGPLSGARHHVSAVDAGQIVLGLLASACPDGWYVLAVGHPGTAVRRLVSSRLPSSGSGPLTDGATADAQASSRAAPHAGPEPALDSWLERLTGAVGGAVPDDCLFIGPGDSVELQAGQAVAPRDERVWLSVGRGSLRWRGSGPLLGPSDGPVPVPNGLWLSASDNATAEGLPSGSEPGLGAPSQIVLHHRAVIELLISDLEAGEARRAGRIALRAGEERRLFDAALADMANVLSGGVPLPPAEAPTKLDDALAVCRLIGAIQGIEFRAPPAERGQVDPVDALSEEADAPNRRVRLTGRWWTADSGPLLGYRRDDDRPVALLPAGRGHYRMVDADGQATPVDETVARSLKPDGRSFYRPLPTEPLSTRKFLQFALRGTRRDFAVLGVSGLAVSLLALVIPITTGVLFDTVVPDANHFRLLELGLLMLTTAVVAALFSLTRNLAIVRIEGRVQASLGPAVWGRLMSLPASFFRTHSSGDLVARANGVETIRQTLSGFAVTSVLSLIFSSTSLVLMFFYSVPLALASLAVVLLLIGALAWLGWHILGHQRKVLDWQGRIYGTLFQLLEGIVKLRVSGREVEAFSRWAERFAEQKKQAVTALGFQNAATVLVGAFQPLLLIFLFAFTVLVLGNNLKAGTFLAFNVALTQFVTALTQANQGLIASASVVPLYQRMRPIIDTRPERDPARASPGRISGAVSVDQVSFRYALQSQLALEGVSMKVNPGDFVAIVGPSGAGKSTIFRLLLGFEQPEQGSIFFDGRDLNDLDLGALRRQIGVVLQTSQLMPGDIFKNIVGTSQLTMEDAWAAAESAAIADDIRAMPMGMHTYVSEGAGTFSGGQIQRLLIARAIVKTPRILLFDEATSALDNRTQQLVTDSLASLRATRIVVAHRLSTVRSADRILVLDDGRVVESGSYHDLMAEQGLFAALALRQLV